MSKKENAPDSFRAQVEEHGQIIQTMVSIATITGYGAGCVAAHTRPVAKAIRTKLGALVPEGIKLAAHAARHAKIMGVEEESFRMAGRATARAARNAKAAGAAAWQAATA